MKFISIETSGPICSVALSEGDTIITEISDSEGNRHDELCAEFVRKLLVENNLTISDIDAIAVSSGPGSFTGLRIGASIAKALCFKENEDDYAPKLFSVPTLSAFAYSAVQFLNFRKVEYSKIIAVIPAQKEVLYFQEFDINFNEISEIRMLQVAEFKQLDFKNTLVCGPRTDILNDLPAPPYLIDYSARLIANLAIRKYNAGEFSNADEFKPLYVQDFVVKTKR